MKTIHVDKSVTTGLDPDVAASTIEIEDTPIGQGGFGIAYRSERFDGHPVRPQVVKLLRDNGSGVAQQGLNTIRELQIRLRKENDRLAGQLLRNYPALQGVPLLSFEGRMDGRFVRGYSAYDLVKGGFHEFAGILENPAKVRAFLALTVQARMRIAAELVEAFELLMSKIQFIHADIKADALFVDTTNFHCAIIDFDSGALVDRPTTFGTRQDWLAPEITSQLDQPGNTTRIIHVDLLSDVWSVNVAIHYLLFGLHPLFFLAEISQRSMDAYLQQYQWPAADPSFRYFRKEKELTLVYRQYMAFVRHSVPPKIMEKLAHTINEGFRDPNRRTLYGQWKSVLKTLNQPAIRSFKPDRTLVIDDTPVHLSWDATGYERLELTHVGDVTNRTSVLVRIIADTTFELILTPPQGQPIRQAVAIEVSKRPPVISAFLASTDFLRDTKTPACLTWTVSGYARLQIDHGVGDVTMDNSAGVLPKSDTTYTLTATSHFGVTATAQVHIRVSTVPPKINFFHADRALLEQGAPVTLSWEATPDAHEVSISGVGAVPVQGSRRIEQRQNRVYVLTAASYFGYSTKQEIRIDVSTAQPVIHDFIARPRVLGEDGATTISWSTSGAASVTLYPIGKPLATSGEQEVQPGSESRLTIRAESWYGVVAERHLTITVIRRAQVDRSKKAVVDRTLKAKRLVPSRSRG